MAIQRLSAYNTEDDGQRVGREVYVYEGCDAAFNADVNGTETVRLKQQGERT